MASKRQVQPELLDELAPSDPRAQRSRRDLRRVNWFMGNARHLSRLLEGLPLREPPRAIAELGGGDGTVMLKVARRLKARWPGVTLRIVDQHQLVTAEIAAQFQTLGWTVQPVETEAFNWLALGHSADLIVTNLFLHHFNDPRLAEFLNEASRRANAVVACEPRRFAFPTLAGQLVRLIGCSSVTRHDAIASIRAGFNGQELSALWPKASGWRLQETNAGLFTHCFSATRS